MSHDPALLNDAARFPLVQAVVFDLDGTLIDSTDAIIESMLHTFREIGEREPLRDDLIRTIGYTMEQHFGLFTSHDVHDCARIYSQHHAKTMCARTRLLPGAAECLAELASRRMKIGFATSKRLDFARILLDELGVLHYFSSQIGPQEVTHPKPHPEAVLKSAAALGVPIDSLVYVGDTDFDVRAAHAAGARCLCVTTGYNTRQQLEALQPEAVYDCLDDVTAHLARLAARDLSLPRDEARTLVET